MSDRNTQEAPATEGQLKQIVRIIQDAFPNTKWIEEFLDQLDLDKDGAQMLIESGNSLHVIRRFLADKVKELSDSTMYADQVVESNYGYLSGYRKARPIDEQVVLNHYDWGRKIDWNLNDVQQQLLAKRAPQGSEGYFAVVFDQTMVTDYEENPGVDQSGPVTLALNALSKQREGRLVNYREGKLGPQYYRRNKKSAEKMKQLWESQGCPTGIILIPAQLGIEHRGKSVLRARMVIRGTEFPLDAYETIQMVLTHKNRLKDFNDLWLDLPGAEYSPGANGVFNNALFLKLHSNKVLFGDCGERGAHNAYERYGSVSGFLPQKIGL
jgi:hypothetical protein